MAGGTIYGSVGSRGDSYSYYIDWVEESINVESNTSLVKAWVHISCSNHSAYQNNCSQNLYINGVHFSNNLYVNLSPGANVTLVYGETTITHDNDGRKRINISADGVLPYGSGWGPSSGSASADVDLEQIPRYADFNEHFIESIDLEAVRVAYNSSKTLVAAEYSLNGGAWQSLTIVSGTWNAANNRVVYQVSGLIANTDYRIETRIAHVSGLWRYSGQISFRTKDYARITSVSSSEFGEIVPMSFSNLENGIAKLTVKISETEICTRDTLTKSYNLIFTEEELSNMIKLLKQEVTEVTYIVTTNNKYSNTVKGSIILKSCIFIKINGTWKKAKLYKKEDEVWKLSKLYIKKSGEWRNTV